MQLMILHVPTAELADPFTKPLSPICILASVRNKLKVSAFEQPPQVFVPVYGG
ncbi:hypothetical protein A2U01_0070070, partial [Trifolium medium]|nr:hypothetical protein [Trifolium medium]